ncbi:MULTISPECIES: LacI family DNA-binding transcriptional regulator [Nocardiopsidaceae]|uniref:LacI family DNA-binding transcriptional regulator n=1 Tax=Streptomonospora nanhaiensis TaxID=1323731 RepID=A0ABY6YG82_9ACTN|nr:LacI family DNA-binding transcriptional regulator [Streptomonospora nanhaiensis]WAE71272.1 LacI family DNA-binding transcriptional regulator [Streptomonospora nanhaiensis]
MGSMMRRPTIMDIARAAGVSKGAVSYALNGRPGVSAQTRERILATARDFGWSPSGPARALSSGGRTATIGLVTRRAGRLWGSHSSFALLVEGVQHTLASTGMDMIVHSDPDGEGSPRRRWETRGRVDGVLLAEERMGRPPASSPAVPALVLGAAMEGNGTLSLPVDDHPTMNEVMHYLVALGHTSLAHVAGPADLAHAHARAKAFEQTARDLGHRAVVVHTDGSGEHSARATRRLLALPESPTALVYDNDVMAVGGLAVAEEMGVAVPSELSIVAWDDSLLCRLVRPALTAVRRDIVGYGRRAAALLIGAVEGAPVAEEMLPGGELVPRESSGPLRLPR